MESHQRRSRSADWGRSKALSKQSDLDNHANQLNPNNDAYWESRGHDERPDDWEEQAAEEEEEKDKAQNKD